MDRLVSRRWRALAAVLLVAAPGLAVSAKETREEKLKKPRLAILDFPAASSGWSCSGWHQSEHRMSDVLRDLFTTGVSEKADRKVRIVERERLNDIRGELSFEQSGEVDGATAQKLGKLLGVRYLLSGKITRFACKKTGASTGWGVGALVGKLTKSGMAGAVAGSVDTHKMKFSGRVDVRLIDVKTGEILGTFKDEEETADTSVKIAGGGTDVDYDEELVNKVYEPIVQRISPKLVKKLLAVHAETLAEDAEEEDEPPPPPRKVAAATVEAPPPRPPPAAEQPAPAPAVAPARAEYVKVPGIEWEQTVAGTMGGVALPGAPQKICVPKDGWDQPPASTEEGCTFTDVKRTGARMTWKMRCEEGLSGDGEMTWTADAFQGSTRMQTPLGPAKMSMTGRRLGGACEALVPRR